MLLAAGIGDFDEMLFGETLGIRQDWRGDRGAVMKRQLADRPARRQVYFRQNDAKLG